MDQWSDSLWQLPTLKRFTIMEAPAMKGESILYLQMAFPLPKFLAALTAKKDWLKAFMFYLIPESIFWNPYSSSCCVSGW